MDSKHPTSPPPLFADSDNIETMVSHLDAEAQAHYQHACEFLLSYKGSPDTFKSYRREIERLLAWTWLIAKKSLTAINHQDFENFVRFCQRPPAHWIGVKQVARFKQIQGERVVNPHWRPFVAKVDKKQHRHGVDVNPAQFSLSQHALQAIFAICSSFFNYLIQENVCQANPVARIRQKSKFIRKKAQSDPIRRLSDLQWVYVIETIEKMADREPEIYERSLFIMRALYAMYLRISELVCTERWSPSMGDFQRDLDGNWWFLTVGKGNKERRISVSDDMLQALIRYRRHLGLSDTPSAGESTPLLQRQRGTGPITSTRAVRKMVQQCFDQAIYQLKQDGFEDEADSLESATVHWLRHTGISDDVKFRPREHVRDDAGHSSSAITDRYIDIELRARHASAKNKKIKTE